MKPGLRQESLLLPLLLDRIRHSGRITFAEFMGTCLYHPDQGYYTKAVRQGADDYYTSPQVHPIFGRLLARQFQEMWEALGKPAPFDLVEFGAGDGRLAEQVVSCVQENSPSFARALRVVLVEHSLHLREKGAERLRRLASSIPVRWTHELGFGAFVGCLYSNEFVDALPVHRVLQRESGLQEIYVTARGEELVVEEGEPSTPALEEYLAHYGGPLQVGQQAEVNLAALAWLEKVAPALQRGFLLTIDYGCLAAELYSPVRCRGTLLAYRKHRPSEDLLACPGEQDLTAHVNLTALIEHGRTLGLLPLGFTTQTKFLLALGKTNEFADLYRPGAGERERYEARLHLKQLIFPAGMGETFKVLVQGKAVGEVRFTGLGEI